MAKSIAKRGLKKLLLVSDPTLEKLGLVKQVIDKARTEGSANDYTQPWTLASSQRTVVSTSNTAHCRSGPERSQVNFERAHSASADTCNGHQTGPSAGAHIRP